MPIDLSWIQRTFPDLQNLQLLARGGQKEVLAAHHSSDGDVVLKLIHPTQDPESVRREILAVSTVQSERVPHILANGRLNTPFGDFLWIREQRISGHSLRQRLARGALSNEHVLKLGLHILEALTAAEIVGVVHRDVKPENIIQDSQGNYWLLDFGIARHLGLSSMTPTALPFGKFTLGYASPEQCRNIKTEIDSRADLFALGVTLYEAGTGQNPFISPPPANDLEKLHRVETMALPPMTLSVVRPELLRDLVSAMTQKRRDLRPRSARKALAWMKDSADANGI